MLTTSSTSPKQIMPNRQGRRPPSAANPGLTEQGASSAARHQEARPAAFQSERARVAELASYQLRGRIGQAQQQLARVISDHTHASDASIELRRSAES